MGGFWQDVRYGLRSLRKSPGFAAAALLMMALGTGANTAMFSVVNAVLLWSPFRDPARIAVFLDRHDPRRTSTLNAPLGDIQHLQATTSIFASVSAFTLAEPILTGVGEPHRLGVECVSASMFRVLGIAPVTGRPFVDDEDRPGGAPVIVISDRLARQAFGGGTAVGRSLTLDDQDVTVVGVMSPEFNGVRSQGTTDVLAPIGQGVGGPSAAGCEVRAGGMNVFTRIQSNLTLPAAEARLMAMTGGTRGLISLDDSTVGDERTTLIMLLGAVGFVLLIACANVANLLLERAVRRRREIATRLALGASPGRLVRQVLTESVLLATLGTLAGVAAAWFAINSLVALLPGLPNAAHVALDGRVLGVALLVGTMAGLLSGAVPALQASSRGLAIWLHDARAVTLPSRSWTKRGLVIAEVALSVALLVGAALMTRSFLTLRPTRPGFDASNKIVASMVLAGARYQTPAPRVAFLDDLTARLARLPGVRGVSAISFAPFSGMLSFLPITVSGRADLADGHVSVFTSAVTANYFDEMRMTITRGRGFLRTDDVRAAPVAIISETLARRVWPDGTAIGADISMNARAIDPTPRRVVGVVSDIRMFSSHTRPSSEIYVPMSQDPSLYLNVVVRTADGAAGDLVPAIRRAAAAVDATQVLDAVRPFDDLLAASVAGRRSITWLMSAFAVMAIGLAVVGLTAVIGASVAQQTREIGIRMTLGARPEAVVGLVLRQAMALALGGVAIGLGVAVATTRFLSDYLYGVTPLDRTTFASSAALMFVVATAASYIPARRATKVDPLVALRAE